MKHDFHVPNTHETATSFFIMKKRSFFFNIETVPSLQISLKITQTSLVFSVETVTGEESREDFEKKKKKRTKIATETDKVELLILIHLICIKEVWFSGMGNFIHLIKICMLVLVDVLSEVLTKFFCPYSKMKMTIVTKKEKPHYNMTNKGNSEGVQGNELGKKRYC
ncbi:hypothetical protein Ahy_B03g065141 isoform A [Arachis hypogaea]|uniref:Uncharacterized protein n=1 Tax=Arachis hypogaea TaxID=3818 RepID=A0A445A0Y1_ARAHY|nr:hypothetical protein Ahy_B03g065141 isoform A [Arachis hypogaea]